jgi:hypothetical protein
MSDSAKMVRNWGVLLQDKGADGSYHIRTDSEWKDEYPGFSCNPLLVNLALVLLYLYLQQAIMLSISMLTFVRNHATNVLALILGLFFKINGPGVHVLKMLGNTGMCVSFDTI